AIIALWKHIAVDRDLRNALLMSGAAILAFVIGAAILVRCTGSLGTVIAIIRTTAERHAIHPYTLQTSTGPGYLLALALGALSPLPVALAACGILVSLLAPSIPSWQKFTRLRDAGAVRLLTILTLGFVGVFAVMPHWLNLRFISAAYPPICLLAGLAL